jgi:hypothetical protein
MAGHLKELTERLKANKLTPEDIRYLVGLTAKAEAEGKVGDRRVVARLPNGMDIVK